MRVLRKIIYAIHMYFEEKSYEKAKANEKLHATFLN